MPLTWDDVSDPVGLPPNDAWGDDPIVKKATPETQQYAQRQLGGAPPQQQYDEDYYTKSATDAAVAELPADVQKRVSDRRAQITPEMRKQQEFDRSIKNVRASYDADPERSQSYRDLQKLERRIPFARHIASARDSRRVEESVARIEKGNYTPEDMDVMANFVFEAAHASEEEKAKPWFQKVKDAVLDMFPYAIEFAATGGAYTAGRATAASIAEKALGGAAKTMAGRIATGIGSRVAGVAAQTAANPALLVSETEKQRLSSVLAGDDQSFLQALPAGVVGAVSEIGSERAGGMIGRVAGKLIPAQLKKAISEAWMAQTGKGTQELAAAVASRTGWNGLVGELGEERVGEVIRGVFGKMGVGDFDFGTTGKLASGDPEGLEQLSVEAAALAVPGAVSSAGQIAERTAERLSQLQAIRGTDSRDLKREAAKLGIEGSRSEIRKKVRQEIEQIEQETTQPVQEPTDASQVQPDQGVLEEQGQVGQGVEADRGGDVREGREEQVPAEPAGEGAPPSEVPVAEEEQPKYRPLVAGAPQPPPKTDPAIPEGMTRLYHGGEEGRYTGAAWYSTNREYAANYRPGAELQYVDVPTEWAMQQLDPDGYGTPASTIELKNDEFGSRKPIPPDFPATTPREKDQQAQGEPEPKEQPEAAPAEETPAVPVDEGRVSELLKELKNYKTGNKKYDAEAEARVRQTVAEEEEASRKYPPGTRLTIQKDYGKQEFEVRESGVYETGGAGRLLNPNPGALLRQYNPEEITVISSPQATTSPESATEVAEPDSEAAPVDDDVRDILDRYENSFDTTALDAIQQIADTAEDSRIREIAERALSDVEEDRREWGERGDSDAAVESALEEILAIVSKATTQPQEPSEAKNAPESPQPAPTQQEAAQEPKQPKKARNIQVEDVEKAFPGATIAVPADGQGWDVHLRTGDKVQIRFRENTAFTAEQRERAEKRYGAKFADDVEYYGSFQFVTRGGEGIPAVSLIELNSRLATPEHLKHEDFHRLVKMAPQSVVDKLAKKYAPGVKKSQREEAIVQRLTEDSEGRVGVVAKMREFISQMLRSIGLGDMSEADALRWIESMKEAEGKPASKEQPKKSKGRKEPPLADMLEPSGVAERAAKEATERGETFIVPFTNQSKREATKKALREAGLEPVPDKLNYWRMVPPPKKTGLRDQAAAVPVGKRGQYAIPGLEEEAATIEAREEEDRRWAPYREQLVASDIGVTEEAARALMRRFSGRVKEVFVNNTSEPSIFIAEQLASDLPIARSGRRDSEQSRRDTAIEMIEPAVAEVMAEIAPTLQEVGDWKVGQSVETRYPQMFGKITGFEFDVSAGEVHARVQPDDGTDSTTVELSDVVREYTPEPEEQVESTLDETDIVNALRELNNKQNRKGYKPLEDDELAALIERGFVEKKKGNKITTEGWSFLREADRKERAAIDSEVQESEAAYRKTLEDAKQAAAKEKAEPKKEDWSVSRADVEQAFQAWGGQNLDAWTYTAGRAVKVLDQPDTIVGDVVGKTFLAPLRRVNDNAHLLWIGGKLHMFSGYEVTAASQSIEDVDMETTVTTRPIGEQTVVKHVVHYRDEQGQDRGEAFNSLAKAKERAKELGKSASVRTESGQIEDREVAASDAPTVVSFEDGRFVLSEDITPLQASAALEAIREQYRYRSAPEIEALKDKLSGEAIKSGREEEPQSLRDKRELYRKAVSEQSDAEAERGRQQTEAARVLERRTKELARERGVPSGQRRGSLSSAKKYSNAIEYAKRDARKDPLVIEAERQLKLAQQAYDTARRHANEFKADLNKATSGERIPEGSVFVSKSKGPSIAIRVGEYDEAKGTYEYESGTVVSSGEFYGHSYGGQAESGITGGAIRENYGSIEESRAMRAVGLQALEAIEQAQESRLNAEREAEATKEADETRKSYQTDYRKPTVAQVMPLGQFMHATYGNKPVITDGRFAIVMEDAPKAMQKRLGVEKIRDGRSSEENPLDISRAIPMKGKLPQQIHLAGYGVRADIKDHAFLTDGETVWMVDAGIYTYMSSEGITFHAPQGDNPVVLAKGGKRIGGVMPLGADNASAIKGESLESLKKAVGDKFTMAEPTQKPKKSTGRKKPAPSAVTPMMERYQEVKREVPDSLLLFRMGDFYELFYDDAKTATKTLGLTLTTRDKASDNPVPMAGFPYHQLDAYIAKLVKAGHKVAVAEPVDPKSATGQQVKRVVTPKGVSGEASKPTERPDITRRVGARKKRPSKPITKEAIQQTFPGAKITAAPGGWHVEIGDSFVTIQVTDQMPEIDWDAAEASIGRRVSQSEREQIQAAGATVIEFPDGTKHDGLGLILLNESLADDAVLRHEAVHLARQAGIIGQAEWETLVTAHARGATDSNVQEERIAQAMEAVQTDTGLWSRIQSWVRRFLANLGIMDYEARDIHQLLRSSGFWARAGKKGESRPRYALRGRPDLANPATEEEARRLVDDVDEARNQRGLPERRADADVENQAAERLQRDYAGERAAMVEAGRTGKQLSDVDTVIAKKIVNREASDAMQSGDTQRITDAMAVIEAYRNTGSEQGRAFRQRQDPVETPAERMARAISEAILEPPQKQRERRNAARREGRHDDADRINEQWAKRFQNLKDNLKVLGVDIDNLWEHGYSRQRAATVLGTIAHAKASGWDKAYEYWRNSILSLPTTQAANVLGNVGHAGWRFTAERFTEALLNTVAKRPEGAQLKEFPHMLAGMLPGLSEGARNFLTTWNTETPTFEARIGREGQWRIEDPHTAIGGKLGRVIRTPQRLLLAVDDFSKTLFTRMEVGANAYRIAKAEELSGEALSHRMQELTLDEESPAWDAAYDSALELTFQQKGGEMLHKVKRNVLAGRRDVPGLRYLLPFVTTPANIFATGIKKSPLGSLGLPLKMYQNHQAGRHVLHGLPADVAQQVLAWALVLILLGNDEEDPWITGFEPATTHQKRQVGYRSTPPASVRLGDKWYSYSRLEPFATVIGTTVDFVNSIRSGDTARQVNVPIATLRGQVGSKTFLSGIGDILDAVQEPSPSEGLAKWSSNFATSWVPNLVRGAGREEADYHENRRVWGTRSDWWKRLGKRTIQKTELPTTIPEYPIYDVWGRPATRSQTGVGPVTDWLYRITVPVRIQKDETFNADRLILNYNLQHAEDERFPLSPSTYYREDGKTIYMTDGQYADMARLSGETAKAALERTSFDVDNPKLEAVEWINDTAAKARGEVRDRLKKRWAGEDIKIDPESLGKAIERDMRQSLVHGIPHTEPKDDEELQKFTEKRSQIKNTLNALGITFAEAEQLLNAHYLKDDKLTKAEKKSLNEKLQKLGELYRD